MDEPWPNSALGIYDHFKALHPTCVVLVPESDLWVTYRADALLLCRLLSKEVDYLVGSLALRGVEIPYVTCHPLRKELLLNQLWREGRPVLVANYYAVKQEIEREQDARAGDAAGDPPAVEAAEPARPGAP